MACCHAAHHESAALNSNCSADFASLVRCTCGAACPLAFPTMTFVALPAASLKSWQWRDEIAFCWLVFFPRPRGGLRPRDRDAEACRRQASNLVHPFQRVALPHVFVHTRSFARQHVETEVGLPLLQAGSCGTTMQTTNDAF